MKTKKKKSTLLKDPGHFSVFLSLLRKACIELLVRTQRQWDCHRHVTQVSCHSVHGDDRAAREPHLVSLSTPSEQCSMTTALARVWPHSLLAVPWPQPAPRSCGLQRNTLHLVSAADGAQAVGSTSRAPVWLSQGSGALAAQGIAVGCPLHFLFFPTPWPPYSSVWAKQNVQVSMSASQGIPRRQPSPKFSIHKTERSPKSTQGPCSSPKSPYRLFSSPRSSDGRQDTQSPPDPGFPQMLAA